MEKNKNGKAKRVIIFISKITLILVLMAVLGFILEIKQNKQLENIQTNANQKIFDIQNKLNESSKNTNKLKVLLNGIKNKDDLLKRDIQLYISARYRRVPKVVSNAIAYNIVTLSKKQQISPELVLGIIQVESSFNPMAIGAHTKYGRARGLMQIMPEWAKKFKLNSKFDLHNINTNILCGIKVIKIHIKENKGDTTKGLYCYVNKDSTYANKVYIAMGKFVSFRSTVDDYKQLEQSKKEVNK